MTKMTERIIDGLLRYRAKNQDDVDLVIISWPPDVYKSDLVNMLKDKLNVVISAAEHQNLNPEAFFSDRIKRDSIIDEVSSRPKFWEAGTASQLANMYIKSRAINIELCDIRSQEAQAHFWEQCRFIVSRTVTALAIASVLVITAIVMKELELTLPITRLPI